MFNDSLASSLSARGLVPVVPGLLLRELSQGPLYQQAVLPMEQAVNLAKAAGAQLVVLGKAELQEGSTGRPQVVSADLQALRTDDGALLSQITTSIEVSADSINAEPSSGLTILAERVAPGLSKALLAPFVARTRTSAGLTVKVVGLRIYGDLITIKQHLEKMSGVKRISKVLLKPREGSVSLQYAGTSEELAHILSDLDFGAFSTRVLSSTEDTITLAISDNR
ncbi:MAG: hypothetical protein JRJ12_14140 [Deltaproteobacteria bacterium]|nr:hypothetical protein [Deltaproteobacteria bacterium]